MPYSAFFGKWTLSSSDISTTINGNSVSLSTGDYYMYSPGSVSYDNFLYYLCGSWAPYQVVTYSVSAVTGYVTLASATPFSYTISDGLADILGLATSGSSQTEFTGTSPMRYCWFPDRMPADSLCSLTRQGVIESFGAQVRAEDGSVYSYNYANLIKQELTFRYIDVDRVWGSSYFTYEQFWDEILSQGKPFVFMPNISDDTYYWEYTYELNDNTIMNVRRDSPAYDGSFTIKMNLLGV